VAKTDLWDNHGDPRGNGRHGGIDMENPWRAPVVAVEDGRIEYSESSLGGCMLYLYGRTGTTTSRPSSITRAVASRALRSQSRTGEGDRRTAGRVEPRG
jgi:hypothetical protein